MTPQGTKAALLELQQAAIARSPHVLDGELDEHEEAEGLKVRARELGLPLNEDVAHVIRSGLQGHEAIPDKPAALRAIMDEAPPYEPNGHAHAVVDIGPEPPPANPIDYATEQPAEPAGGHPPKFRCIAIDEVQPSAEPAWCVHRILPARGLACFVGAPKSGKSFLASDMLFAVARGVPYAGRETLPGPVIYLTGEGVAGFKRRLVALRRHHGVEGQGVPFYMVENVPDLGSEQTDLAVLLAEIDAFLEQRQLPPPRAIVLDTLARCMGAGDENTAKDMGRFVARCGMIERHFGCLIAVVHHFGKDKERGGRGSNSLNGAADVTLQIEKFEGWNRVHVSEMKDGVEGQEWRFRLNPYEIEPDETEKLRTSCAVVENLTCVVEILSEPAGAQPRATKQARPPVGVAADLLKVLRRAVDEAGQTGIAGSGAPANVRAVKRDMLKKYCATMDWQQDKEDNSFRSVLSNNLSTLRSRDLIGFDQTAVWVTGQ